MNNQGHTSQGEPLRGERSAHFESRAWEEGPSGFRTAASVMRSSEPTGERRRLKRWLDRSHRDRAELIKHVVKANDADKTGQKEEVSGSSTCKRGVGDLVSMTCQCLAGLFPNVHIPALFRSKT